MRLSDSTGWRTVAVVNVVWLTVATVVLVAFVIAGSVAGGGVTSSFIFYTGRCRGADVYRLNTGLHLLLNVFSTAVLASSNFFIQILSSPTRPEVDAAHAKGGFLHIGVISASNAVHLSRFKCRAWVLLLLSSVPLHLLFNAAVFEVDSRESNYFLAIADEGFIGGQPFYLPGASLAAAGLQDVNPKNRGYGSTEYIGMYYDPGGPPQPYWPTDQVRNVSVAAASAKAWTRLEKEACAGEYLTCRGLQNYDDVVVVVESSDGWVRDRLWELGANATGFWSTRVPGDRANSLWYSAACSMTSGPVPPGRIACSNSCFAALGANNSEGAGGPVLGPASDWTIPFFAATPWASNSTPQRPQPAWDAGMYSGPGGTADFGLREGRDRLPVKYCLARPADQAAACGVGLSNLLLLCVALCTLVKTATAAVVLWRFGGEQMLVTLGDAVASFIARPDETTMATDYLIDKKLAGKLRGPDAEVMPTPWQTVYRRGFAAINPAAWATHGLILLIGILACATFATMMIVFNGGTPINIFMGDNKKDKDLGTDYSGPGATMGIIIAINAPQLGLSIWHLAYNAFLTRLHMAREWATFSTAYRPLRVTSPQGRQVSTYRLQLPYRYSIPSLFASAILHWLMANAFYVFVSRGSYFYRSRYQNGREVGWSDNDQLPSHSILSLRYSASTALVMWGLATAMVLILLGLAFRRLPGYMPIVGTFSVLISAACHVSPLVKVHPLLYMAESDEPKPSSGERGNIEEGDREQPERGDEEEGSPVEPGADLRVKATQSLLRWGVVEMPPEWLATHQFHDGAQVVEVQHLSFGTGLDGVQDPVDGRFYD